MLLFHLRACGLQIWGSSLNTINLTKVVSIKLAYYHFKWKNPCEEISPSLLSIVSHHLKLLDLIWGMYILLNTLLSLWYISIPTKINWEENIPRDTTEWEWQVAVCKLFEEQPIWPRRSLHEHLLDDGMQVSENQLKRFPIHSFNFHRCHGLSFNEFHVLWFCCYWLYVLVLPFLNEQNWGNPVKTV